MHLLENPAIVLLGLYPKENLCSTVHGIFINNNLRLGIGHVFLNTQSEELGKLQACNSLAHNIDRSSGNHAQLKKKAIKIIDYILHNHRVQTATWFHFYSILEIVKDGDVEQMRGYQGCWVREEGHGCGSKDSMRNPSEKFLCT